MFSPRIASDGDAVSSAPPRARQHVRARVRVIICPTLSAASAEEMMDVLRAPRYLASRTKSLFKRSKLIKLADTQHSLTFSV